MVKATGMRPGGTWAKGFPKQRWIVRVIKNLKASGVKNEKHIARESWIKPKRIIKNYNNYLFNVLYY